MNLDTFLGLLHNAALLLAVCFIYDLVAVKWRPGRATPQQAWTGLILGAMGVVIMLTPWQLKPGVFFDTRSVLLGVSGLFFGTTTTVTVIVMTGLFRVFQGGAGTLTGVLVIISSGMIGIVWRYLRKDKLSDLSWLEIYGLGLLVHVVMLLLMLTLPWPVAQNVLSRIALPVLIIYPAGTALVGVLMRNRLAREKSSLAVAEREELFRSLFENNHAVMFILDPEDGSIVDANPAAAEFYGWPRPVLCQMKIDQINRLSFSEIKEEMRKAKLEERRKFFFQHVLADGSLCDVEVYSGPISVEGRSLLYSIIHDVTERRRAENALRESEERYRDVAEAHTGVVWETDADFIVTHLSGRVVELFGYDPEEIIGRDFFYRIDSEDRARVEAVTARLAQEGQTVKGLEYWRRHKDGRRVRMLTNGKAFFGPDGRFLGARGAHMDLTETHWARLRRDILLQIHEMSDQSDARISAFLCEACAELTDSPMSFFGMVEADESAMIAHVWSPQAVADCKIPEKPLRFPIEEAGLWAEPIRRREAMIFNDYGEAKARRGLPEGHVPLTRFLGVPIVAGDKVIAVAGAANRSSPYDDRHILRLRLITSTVTDFLDTRRKEQSLHESEERLQALLTHSPLLISEFDRTGRYLLVNPAAAEMFNLSPSEVVGRKFSDLLPEPTVGQFKDRIKKVTELGQPITIEDHLPEADRDFITTLFPLFDADGSIRSIGAIAHDITELKRAEEALEASLQKSRHRARELQYLFMAAQAVLEGGDFHRTARSIFEAASDLIGARSGYVSLDTDQGRTEVLFQEPEKEPGAPGPDWSERLGSLWEEVGESGEAVFSNDYREIHRTQTTPAGREQVRNVLLAPLNIEGKTVGAMVLADKAADFTEDDLRIAGAFGQLTAIALRNTRTMEALTESRAILQAAMDNSQAGIAIADAPDGRLRYVNEAGLFIRGGSKEQIVQDVGIEQYVGSWRILHLDGTPYEPDEVPLTRAVKYGEVSSREFIIRRSAMEDRIVLANAAPIRNESGRVVAGVVVFHDITKLREAESVRESLNAQLQQAQKMEAVGTLAGGVAHDFNNLLQAINGYTQLLLMDKSEDDPDYSGLAAIQNSGRRAADLVRSLLLFSRKAETEHKPIELNMEVEHARKILERTIPRMVDMELRTSGRLWNMVGDPVQVEQILLNLGTNAADAMPDGGRLVIETSNVVLDAEYVERHPGARPGRFVQLAVSDTGSGMDQETMANIFEPFFTTKEIGKGTGLGLASVYGIVKNHGGYINCESELGQGSTFRIFFPALEEPETAEKQDEVVAPPRGDGEFVLLVDDEEAIRGFAQQALVKFGYQVRTASTGEEALELYSQQSGPVDLVLMDLSMPGMGGHKCLQEILKLNPDQRVLIASGYAVEGQVEKSMEAGAVGYVGKPYQLADLLTSVRAALDPKS